MPIFTVLTIEKNEEGIEVKFLKDSNRITAVNRNFAEYLLEKYIKEGLLPKNAIINGEFNEDEPDIPNEQPFSEDDILDVIIDKDKILEELNKTIK